MKLTLTILCACLVGCHERPQELPVPISVEMLRKASVENKMRILKETQFMGDAELGLHGGADMLREIAAQAKNEFPDGDYVYLPNTYHNSPPIAGYKHHGMCSVEWYTRPIYKKIEVELAKP